MIAKFKQNTGEDSDSDGISDFIESDDEVSYFISFQPPFQSP